MTAQSPSAASEPNGRTEPQAVAALDLGSNSFHMVIGRLEAGQIRIVDRLREGVRLAAGLDANKNITPDAMERALACLKRFGQRVSDMPQGTVRAVGTNTLRQAHNSDEFLQRAREALGHPIEVIAGLEEARLIYLGMAQTTPGDGGRRLVVDIGGGSTEFIIGQGFDILEEDSLYMGCVSFSEKYFPGGRIDPKCFRDAMLAAELELVSITRAYKKVGWQAEIGCSGTILSVEALCRENGWSEEGITPGALKKLRKALLAAGRVDDLKLEGLDADRRPVIAGGVAVLEAIFDTLGLSRMVPSQGALREGVLYDLVGRIRHEDVRDRTIRWFCEHYRVDGEQAQRVGDTALSLVEQAARTWPIDVPWASQVIGWAARLHEIGLAISHTGYHKHSAYLVANSHMAGFSRGEQALLASLIRSHRRKLKPENFAGVDPARLEDVKRLSLLLRLAVVLNRSRDLEVPTCVLRAKKERLKLHFPDGWLEQHPLTETVLAQEADYLKGFGYELVIKSAELPE